MPVRRRPPAQRRDAEDAACHVAVSAFRRCQELATRQAWAIVGLARGSGGSFGRCCSWRRRR